MTNIIMEASAGLHKLQHSPRRLSQVLYSTRIVPNRRPLFVLLLRPPKFTNRLWAPLKCYRRPTPFETAFSHRTRKPSDGLEANCHTRRKIAPTEVAQRNLHFTQSRVTELTHPKSCNGTLAPKVV